jgi:hypothetical protein
MVTFAKEKIVKKGWFVKVQTILKSLVKARNKRSEENPSEAINETSRASRTLLNKEVQKAKNISEYKKAVGIYASDTKEATQSLEQDAKPPGRAQFTPPYKSSGMLCPRQNQRYK